MTPERSPRAGDEASSGVFCLNDWDIRKLFWVVVPMQLAVIALVDIDSPLPILSLNRAVVGSIYLAVIPGTLILRILRLHELGTTRTLVYTICLSLAFAMLLGFVGNASYPSFGVTRPLSPWPIAITYASALALLSIGAYHRDRNYRPSWQPAHISAGWPLLFLLLLPLATAFGAELVNSNGDNSALMVLLPVVALTPILAVWFRLIPENLYPWLVFTVAVSVLLQVSLISGNLSGLDTQVEYRVFELAEQRSVWESISPANTYNSTLSVTILPVVISRLTGLEGLHIFKVVFPVLLGLVPLAMYEVLRQYVDRKWALLAVFLLIFQYGFFSTMPLAAKQTVGWIFMSAMVLTLVEKPGIGASSLRVAFLLAVVVSHYATAFLCVALLAGAVPVLAWQRQSGKDINVNLAILALTATIGWYLYSANSTTFDTFARLGEQFIDSLSSGFMDPGSTYSADLVTRSELSLARSLLKYLYVALQAFIALGVVTYVWRWIRKKPVEFSAEFMSLSAVSAGVYVGAVGVPYLASFGDINRLFTLPMFFLAPFAIAGVETILGTAFGIWTHGASRSSEESSGLSQTSSTRGSEAGGTLPTTKASGLARAFIALFAAAFFLLGSGFVSEIMRDKYPLSFAVSGDRMHAPVVRDEDLRGAEWLNTVKRQPVGFFYDFFAWPIYIRLGPHADAGGALYLGMLTVTGQETLSAEKEIPHNSYILLSGINVRSGELALAQTVSSAQLTPLITPIEELPLPYYEAIVDGGVIYDNGGSRVILSP